MAQAQSSDPTAIPAASRTLEALSTDLSSQLGPLLQYFNEIYRSVVVPTLSWNGVIEIAAITLVGLLAWLLAIPARRVLDQRWPATTTMPPTGIDLASTPVLRRLRRSLHSVTPPLLWVIGLWLASALVNQLGLSSHVLRLAVSLLNAWVVIHLFSSVVRDPLWSKLFATVAWIVAALNILNLLSPTIDLLEGVGISFGESRLSLFMLLKASVYAAFLIWAATTLAGLFHTRITRSASLTSSAQTLLSQAARLTLLFGAIMLALNAIGVDLTALAVFSGAVGVGIGFGLQSIFSNLMSGIILLLERSVKIGDFIEFENGLAGEVKEINTRATRVTTNDNVDILVPNSEFINNRVTNWTMVEGYRRIRVPFGVAYGTDKDLVRTAVLEAAEQVPHMLQGPLAKPPQVWLIGFGDSSLDFELVVWLRPESVKRPSAVLAEYNWAIETALGKYDIEIPFPQRDLHIRSGRLPVQMLQADID